MTRSNKMVYKSFFGTIGILHILKEEKMLIIVVKKMIVVSAKIKKLWRVKVSGGESSHLRKISLKLCSIFWVFFHSNHHYIQELC